MKPLKALICLLYCVGIFGSQSLLAATNSSSVEREIVFRQMTAQVYEKNFPKQRETDLTKQPEKEKSLGQQVFDAPTSVPANALYGAAGSFADLTKQATKVVETSASSPAVKKALYSGGKKVLGATTRLDQLDRFSTVTSLLGSVAGKDPEGVATGLINGTASGMSASAGAELGVLIGSPLGPVGALVGGVVGGFAGALAYNEVVAPQVEKGGDWVSNNVQDGNEVIRQKKIRIQQAYDTDLATVYPDPKDRPDPNNELERDAVTGMNYNLRPDVLGQRAMKIRKERQAAEQRIKDKAFQMKMDKAIADVTKKEPLPISTGYTPSGDVGQEIEELQQLVKQPGLSSAGKAELERALQDRLSWLKSQTKDPKNEDGSPTADKGTSADPPEEEPPPGGQPPTLPPAEDLPTDLPPPDRPGDGKTPDGITPPEEAAGEGVDNNLPIIEIVKNPLENKINGKKPPSTLQDAEGNLPAMGTIPAGDTDITSQFVDDSTQQGREDGQAASDLNQLNSDVQQASTSGDGQTAESRNAINDAAVQGQRTLNKAQNTANASDMNNSVGAQLTEEVSSGIKQGFEAAGTALGAALGTKLADQIIKDEKKDERAENRPPAAGESPSATATSVAAGGGTKTPPKLPPKPTKTRCPICGSYNCNSAGEKRPATQVIYGPIIP